MSQHMLYSSHGKDRNQTSLRAELSAIKNEYRVVQSGMLGITLIKRPLSFGVHSSIPNPKLEGCKIRTAYNNYISFVCVALILQGHGYTLQLESLLRKTASAVTFHPVEHIPLFHSTIPFHHSSPVIVDYPQS